MKSPVSAPKRAPFCPAKHVGGLRSHVSTSISSQSEYSIRSLKIAPPNSRGSLQIVCTSEHWYEEEEEFDSLTDALKPKTLLLVVPSPDAAAHENEISSLRESLQTTEFAVGFCSSADIDYATKLWAGRDKPPLFLKMRRRVTLDAADRVPEFLSEVLQQNWRLDLDAGLGIIEPPAENILLICSDAVGKSLVEAFGGEGDGQLAPLLAVLAVEGTQAGDPSEWIRLKKKVVSLSKRPQSGEIINI